MPTRYIQNGRDCAKIKSSIPLQHRNGLTGLSLEITYVSYTNRYRQYYE